MKKAWWIWENQSMYNHNKAQQSKNRVHISWDILYIVQQSWSWYWNLLTTNDINYLRHSKCGYDGKFKTNGTFTTWFNTPGRHRHRRVFSSFHASGRPSVPLSVCLTVRPARRYHYGSLKLDRLGPGLRNDVSAVNLEGFQVQACHLVRWSMHSNMKHIAI